MNTRVYVHRGLERLMARRAAGLLGERYGLSGLGACDTFDQLEDSLSEAGVPGGDKAAADMRQMHRCGCQRIMQALPVAVDAMKLQAMGGHEVALAGIFSKIGKALKKVSLSHILVPKLAKKLDKLDPLTTKLTKEKQSAAQKAAAAAKKQAKKEAKAAKKAKKAADKAAAALAAANAQNLSPVDAGAAVLANQAGLNIQTPDGAAFAQGAVQSAGGGGGGGSPMATDDPNALTTDSAGADDSTIFGLPPMVAGGIALAGVGVLWLAFGGKKK